MPTVSTGVGSTWGVGARDFGNYSAIQCRFDTALWSATTVTPILGEPVIIYHNGTEMVCTNVCPAKAVSTVAGSFQYGVILESNTAIADESFVWVAVAGKVTLRVKGTASTHAARGVYYKLSESDAVSQFGSTTDYVRCAILDGTVPSTNSIAYAVVASASAATTATQTVSVFLYPIKAVATLTTA